MSCKAITIDETLLSARTGMTSGIFRTSEWTLDPSRATCELTLAGRDEIVAAVCRITKG